MDEAFEVYGSAIVAGGEAPEMLEAAKASFNLIAMFVSGFVVGDKVNRPGFPGGSYL